MASRDFWTKFVWGDWRKDARLSRCSRAAKGAWMDFLAFVFESESEQPGYAVADTHGPDRVLAWLDYAADTVSYCTEDNVMKYLNGIARRHDEVTEVLGE